MSRLSSPPRRTSKLITFPHSTWVVLAGAVVGAKLLVRVYGIDIVMGPGWLKSYGSVQ